MDMRAAFYQMCLSAVIFLTWISHASFSHAGQLCTKSVAVKSPQQQKRVSMIRRIPAACSNWDRSWAWLTKVDCGTKYKREYVMLPNTMVTYRLEYVCCDDDIECKSASVTDSNALLIIISVSVAALLVLMVIATLLMVRYKIWCCYKKDRNRRMYGNEHIYESVDDHDAHGKVRLSESQYAEVCKKRQPDDKTGLSEEKQSSQEDGKFPNGRTRSENTYVPFGMDKPLQPALPSAPCLDDIYTRPQKSLPVKGDNSSSDFNAPSCVPANDISDNDSVRLRDSAVIEHAHEEVDSVAKRPCKCSSLRNSMADDPFDSEEEKCVPDTQNKTEFKDNRSTNSRERSRDDVTSRDGSRSRSKSDSGRITPTSHSSEEEC